MHKKKTQDMCFFFDKQSSASWVCMHKKKTQDMCFFLTNSHLSQASTGGIGIYSLQTKGVAIFYLSADSSFQLNL